MIEPDMNPLDLWLEEIFTDRRVGTIRRMTPVKGDGTRDPEREVSYIGETPVMSQIGTLPITFVLEARVALPDPLGGERGLELVHAAEPPQVLGGTNSPSAIGLVNEGVDEGCASRSRGTPPSHPRGPDDRRA